MLKEKIAIIEKRTSTALVIFDIMEFMYVI